MKLTCWLTQRSFCFPLPFCVRCLSEFDVIATPKRYLCKGSTNPKVNVMITWLQKHGFCSNLALVANKLLWMKSIISINLPYFTRQSDHRSCNLSSHLEMEVHDWVKFFFLLLRINANKLVLDASRAKHFQPLVLSLLCLNSKQRLQFCRM